MFYRAYSSLFLAESILFSVWTLSVHKLPGPFVWQQAHFFTHYSFLGPDWCQVLHIESDSPIIWILAKLESIHGNDMSKMGQRAFWSSRCGTVVCATCTLTEFIWFQKCIAALFTNVRNTCLLLCNTSQMIFTGVFSLFYFAERCWSWTLIALLDKSNCRGTGSCRDFVTSLLPSLSAYATETCCSVSVGQRSWSPLPLSVVGTQVRTACGRVLPEQQQLRPACWLPSLPCFLSLVRQG